MHAIYESWRTCRASVNVCSHPLICGPAMERWWRDLPIRSVVTKYAWGAILLATIGCVLFAYEIRNELEYKTDSFIAMRRVNQMGLLLQVFDPNLSTAFFALDEECRQESLRNAAGIGAKQKTSKLQRAIDDFSEKVIGSLAANAKWGGIEVVDGPIRSEIIFDADGVAAELLNASAAFCGTISKARQDEHRDIVLRSYLAQWDDVQSRGAEGERSIPNRRLVSRIVNQTTGSFDFSTGVSRIVRSFALQHRQPRCQGANPAIRWQIDVVEEDIAERRATIVGHHDCLRLAYADLNAGGEWKRLRLLFALVLYLRDVPEYRLRISVEESRGAAWSSTVEPNPARFDIVHDYLLQKAIGDAFRNFVFSERQRSAFTE